MRIIDAFFNLFFYCGSKQIMKWNKINIHISERNPAIRGTKGTYSTFKLIKSSIVSFYNEANTECAFWVPSIDVNIAIWNLLHSSAVYPAVKCIYVSLWNTHSQPLSWAWKSALRFNNLHWESFLFKSMCICIFSVNLRRIHNNHFVDEKNKIPKGSIKLTESRRWIYMSDAKANVLSLLVKKDPTGNPWRLGRAFPSLRRGLQPCHVGS